LTIPLTYLHSYVMKATILYSKGFLPENDAAHTVEIGGQVFEGVSTNCFVKVHGGFTADPTNYELVARATTGSDTAKDADTLFAALNGYGEAEIEPDRDGASLRSMSVGDVVVFDSGRAFVCQGIGWAEVQLPSRLFPKACF
jgi:hypothetical protein